MVDAAMTVETNELSWFTVGLSILSRSTWDAIAVTGVRDGPTERNRSDAHRDAVERSVVKHHDAVRVESKPGHATVSRARTDHELGGRTGATDRLRVSSELYGCTTTSLWSCSQFGKTE